MRACATRYVQGPRLAALASLLWAFGLSGLSTTYMLHPLFTVRGPALPFAQPCSFAQPPQESPPPSSRSNRRGGPRVSPLLREAMAVFAAARVTYERMCFV